MRAEIKAGGFRAALREREGDITGAAAQVKRAVAVFYLGEFNDAAFPKPVQAEALEVIQKIIAAGDAGEEVVDLRGTLIAGRVIGVAHAASLAAAAAQGQPRNVFASDTGFARFGSSSRLFLINSFMSAVGTPKKILVVDDNEIVLKTISLKLQGAGYEVLTAMDGSDAVSIARQDAPDLILLDLSFPPAVEGVPWDGFRIMEWFHRLDNVKKIPVIVITGTDDPVAKQRATNTGAVAFFQKPIEHDYLLKVIRATLGETVR